MLPFTAQYHELQVEHETKEKHRIDAMRARREQRVERFMDPRQRTAGIDLQGIEEQIAEKERAVQAQKALEAAAFEEAEHNRILAEAVERQTFAQKRKAALETLQVVQAQASELGCFKRTTADINDKHALPHSEPMRIGEDPDIIARVRLQRAQQSGWIQQQILEREENKAKAREENMHWAGNVRQAVDLGNQVEDMSRMERMARARKVREENEAELERQRQEATLKRAHEHREEAKAMQTTVTHGEAYGFLGGKLSDGINSENPARWRVDHYRGAAPKDVMAKTFLSSLEQQEQQKRSIHMARQEEEAAAHAVAMDSARIAALRERELAAAKARQKADTAAALGAQVEEARARREAERRERMNISIGNEFYGKFGVSDR